MLLWSEPQETGHEVIDAEHRAIVESFGEVLAAVDAGNHWQARRAMEGMLDRVARHFGHEDLLMRTTGYPGFPRHAEAHRLFLADAAAFAKELGARGITEAFRRWSRGRMLEWSRFHVSANDVALGNWLVARDRAALQPAPQLDLPL